MHEICYLRWTMFMCMLYISRSDFHDDRSLLDIQVQPIIDMHALSSLMCIDIKMNSNL